MSVTSQRKPKLQRVEIYSHFLTTRQLQRNKADAFLESNSRATTVKMSTYRSQDHHEYHKNHKK